MPRGRLVLLMGELTSRRPARYGGRTDTALAVVLDCNDLDRMAAFWSAALGYRPEPAEPGPGPYRALLPAAGDGVELLLQAVPEPRTAKNRMHLDLRVLDLDAEVARLLALGARRVTREGLPARTEEAGWLWEVLADPEGNEFCVLRPPDGHRDGLAPPTGA